MIILNVSCNNMYMFKKLNVDFTYNKLINHSLAKNDILFPGSRIKVRKNIILMGVNASGKTTFGKLMCLILNYIYRGKIDSTVFPLERISYEKDQPSSFSMEFVIDQHAYLLDVKFNGSTLISETLRHCPIYKSYNISALRAKLYSIPTEYKYYTQSHAHEKKGDMLLSKIFFDYDDDFILNIKLNTHFVMKLSTVNNLYRSESDVDTNQIEMLDKLLPEVDDSVEGVKPVYAENRQLIASYLIKFKNGEELLVPNGNTSKCDDRLSHGTFEVINFINIITNALNTSHCITYIDENLTHLHSELEAYLIRKLCINKPASSQLIVTTHNLEIFKLNIPIHSFIFFKRNQEGFNEVVYPHMYMNKNDRNITSYYENDYFGILPDYTVMDSLFTSGKEGDC